MLKEKNIIRICLFPIFGKRIFQPWIVKREGGSQLSSSLRQLCSKIYNVHEDLYTYGGCFEPSFNYAVGGTVTIGRYCSFAQDIHYFAADHPVNHISMSPYFYNKSFGFNVDDIKREKLDIGHGVWCGYGVLITSKCTHVGNGSVIAAGAVVTKDVPAYSIVAGNPAKIIKYRFTDSEIEAIEATKWWEKNPEELMSLYNLMESPIRFTKAFNEIYGNADTSDEEA